MARKYTGWDKDAAGKRAGAERWFALCIEFSEGALWNNGSWLVRNKKGKQSPSVHGTGRAADLSYRKLGNKGVANGRQKAVEVMDFLVANAETLGLEAILDYFPKPYGRGYMCDRDSWAAYKKPTVSGAPGGDWIHVEVSNEMADSVAKVNAAWAKATGGKLGGASAEPEKVVAPKPQNEPAAAEKPKRKLVAKPEVQAKKKNS
jgi:hypothetical protein